MRRWTLTILICLFLGAAANIAVAFACAYWSPLSVGAQVGTTSSSSDTPLNSTAITLYNNGHRRENELLGTNWARRLNDLNADIVDQDDFFTSRLACILIGFGIRWEVIYRTPYIGPQTIYSGRGMEGGLLHIECGWPLSIIALRSNDERTVDATFLVFAEATGQLNLNSQFSFVGGQSVTAVNSARGGPLHLHRMVPLGAIVNTLLYASCLYVLWIAPGRIRRFIRHARGRCPRCAYDLRGEFVSGCPECGWNRDVAVPSLHNVSNTHPS